MEEDTSIKEVISLADTVLIDILERGYTENKIWIARYLLSLTCKDYISLEVMKKCVNRCLESGVILTPQSEKLSRLYSEQLKEGL